MYILSKFLITSIILFIPPSDFIFVHTSKNFTCSTSTIYCNKHNQHSLSLTTLTNSAVLPTQFQLYYLHQVWALSSVPHLTFTLTCLIVLHYKYITCFFLAYIVLFLRGKSLCIMLRHLNRCLTIVIIGVLNSIVTYISKLFCSMT
jgi:hypothetical protein